MSGHGAARTVAVMNIRSHRHHLRTAVGSGAAIVAALGLTPVAAQAAGSTQSLRFFVKDTSTRLTTKDGRVVSRPPYPAPHAGDVLDVTSQGYVGSHRHHATRPTISVQLRCVFAAAGPPDCVSRNLIGGSTLIVRGNPGTIIGGTGRYQGATGRVLENKEVAGGSDVVVRIHLAAASQRSPASGSPCSEVCSGGGH
jgi:hypothetical protein